MSLRFVVGATHGRLPGEEALFPIRQQQDSGVDVEQQERGALRLLGQERLRDHPIVADQACAKPTAPCTMRQVV